MSTNRVRLLVAALTVCASVSAAAPAKSVRLTLTTGQPGGTYYKIGTSMAKIVSPQGIKITTSASNGSGENLFMTSLGHADLALMQLDYYSHFLANSPEFSKRVQVVAPLYNEEIHVLVRKDAGIRSLAALKGRTMNVGPAASGTYFSAKVLLGLNKLNPKKDVKLDFRSTDQAMLALITGEIDAIFFTGGKPVKYFRELPAAAGARLDFLDLHVAAMDNPAVYVSGTIGPKDYPWLKRTVNTVATPCALVAGKDVDRTVVSNILEHIYDNRLYLFSEHSKWDQARIRRLKTLHGRDELPFHQGAIDYMKLQEKK
jgi:TRAP transporter TAXI family solute receptor